MPTTTRGKQLDEAPSSSASKPSGLAALFCCCSVSDVVQEVQLTAAALNKPPPIELSPGHANAENEARGMAAPKWGCLEVVNKNKDGEIVAVLVAQNASELVLDRRDPNGYAAIAFQVGCMPPDTVICGTFDEGWDVLQIALLYGCKYKTIERARAGSVRDNFEFIKIYECRCRGKNVLVKYKAGDLELQKGGGSIIGTRRSQGGGIDMKTNVERLVELHSENLE